MQQGVMLNAVEWLSLVAVLGLLLSIAKILIGKQTKQFEERLLDNEKRIIANEKEIEKIRLNYIQRFDELKETLNDTKTEIIEAVNGIKIDIAKNYMTKIECRYIEKHN